MKDLTPKFDPKIYKIYVPKFSTYFFHLFQWHHMNTLRNIALLGLSLSATGCSLGNWNSIHRDFDINSNGALIDIKQRAIVVAKKFDEQNHPILKVCAEPSPDAFSAYAAELVAQGTLPQGEAIKLAGASQEGSAFVGLRTQTIQLLRDELYRLCEDYINGDTDGEHQVKQRRMQRQMVAMLAIEQLTGVIKAPPITINTQGSAEVGRSLEEFSQQFEAVTEKISENTDDISELNKQIASIDSQIGSEEVDTLKQELTDKKQGLSEQKTKLTKMTGELKKNQIALEEGMKNARGLLVSGSTSAEIKTEAPRAPDFQSVQTITSGVKCIVDSVVTNHDDHGEACLAWTSDYLYGKIKTDKLELILAACNPYLNTNLNQNNKPDSCQNIQPNPSKIQK